MRSITMSRLKLLAPVALLAAASPALATNTTLAVSSLLFAGPGAEYAVIGSFGPGAIDLGQCLVNPQHENWCFAKRPGEAGWILYIEAAATPAPASASPTTKSGGDEQPTLDKGAIRELASKQGNPRLSPVRQDPVLRTPPGPKKADDELATKTKDASQ
ncbi:MAG: hypothetical protein ABL879_05695 [Devosia sp.]